MSLFGTANGYTHACMMDKLSIVWAPKGDYTQTFSNRVHTMTGDLVISNGTLAVDGETSFKNVGRIIVVGGRFLLNSTLSGALTGVTNLVVKNGGTFEVVSGATPFTAGKAILEYETGAAFKLPAGDSYDFAGVKLDGEPLDGDTYHPGGTIPGLTGGDIIARDFPVTTTSATWDGGATPDDSIATPENWTGDAAPALTGGGLVATFGDSGTRADIDRNVDWAGAVFNRNFTLDGTGTLTLRSEGLTVGANCTNTLNAAVKLRGNQEWNVGAGGRLNVNTGLTDHFGSSAIHKTGAGMLWLNAPSDGMGPFTLGSSSANGGRVYVNTSTNAFGPASDTHKVTINSVKDTNPAQGGVTFRVSTVVERPIAFGGGGNAYFNFYVNRNVTARFTKRFSHSAAMRLYFEQGAHVICEGGMALVDWTCFSGASDAKWTIRGTEPISVDYLYLPTGPSLSIENETTANNVRAIEMLGTTTVAVKRPYGLNKEAMRLYLRAAGAVLDVTGDQQIGGFLNMTGGAITSAVPSTVYFSQYDWYNPTSPKVKPITNTAVRITGAVTLYKRGTSLYVQDCAAPTTGGIGVGEGTLRLTAKATFRNATRFLVEDTGRAEVEAKNLIGREAEVFYDTTAALKLDADQRVAAFYVDGQLQKPGIYGSAASGAPNTVTGFEGTGRLIVGRRGVQISFK